jgi:hypothetical protein
VAKARRWARLGAFGLLTALVGGVVGAVVALATPAHVEIAGSNTRVRLAVGSTVDQFGVPGLVTIKRATSRSVFGEPLGVRAVLDLNVAQLVNATGQFNPDVLPAYIQAYSDPKQLASDIRNALLAHVLWCVGSGAGLALLGAAAWRAYRRWRASYDRTHRLGPADHAAARAYRAPERIFAGRVAVALVVLGVIATVPSGLRHAPVPATVRPEPILAGGRLAGVEVDGLLRPALVAAENYVQTYFSRTDTYYDQLRAKVTAYLDQTPVTLPSGDDVAQFGYVTDRHCNTGMDRVDIALLEQLGVKTLVSGGDDAFSGTFAFESACTRGLAEKSHKAGITDVFVGGNHDSAQTIGFEQDQKIKTLTGSIVTVDGLHFLGSPDPRSSRYGEGIQPASVAVQLQLVDAQGRAAGKTACASANPVIAILHDPTAGAAALDSGCGKVTLALDGHTHAQSGPNAVPLPNGQAGYQFVGASAGGAPGEKSLERSFASRLTVGPLNHAATVEIVSVERSTGRLVGVTAFRFTPDQQIVVTQQRPAVKP